VAEKRQGYTDRGRGSSGKKEIYLFRLLGATTFVKITRRGRLGHFEILLLVAKLKIEVGCGGWLGRGFFPKVSRRKLGKIAESCC